MTTQLFKTFDIPIDVEDDTAPPHYGTAPRFDFEKGDFILQAGRLVMIEGYHAWVQWCVKTVLTQRYRFIIYDDDYGTELEDLERHQRSQSDLESFVEETIRDALMQDDRTGSVNDFTVRTTGDELHVDFWIEPAVGPGHRVSIEITGR